MRMPARVSYAAALAAQRVASFRTGGGAPAGTGLRAGFSFRRPGLAAGLTACARPRVDASVPGWSGSRAARTVLAIAGGTARG
jgi:hypothetical protein